MEFTPPPKVIPSSKPKRTRSSSRAAKRKSSAATPEDKLPPYWSLHGHYDEKMIREGEKKHRARLLGKRQMGNINPKRRNKMNLEQLEKRLQGGNPAKSKSSGARPNLVRRSARIANRKLNQ